MKCRSCGSRLTREFIDLVNAPPSNSFLTAEQLDEPEVYFPLKLFVCDSCFLIQVDEYKKSEDIFNRGYLYFSSFSKSWLAHARDYVDMMVCRFGYGPNSRVVEIASNDGYLLQYFREKGIPALGIEPAEGTAAEARKKGIETIVEYFGSALAKKLADQGTTADLLIGNNVLAHVPDLNDFVAGLGILLKPDGVITMEFPHLMQLVDNCQFDTIYHEHFSYLSLLTVRRLFNRHGLELFDVEEIPTHGGSLRIFARRAESTDGEPCANVTALLKKESARGLDKLAYYSGFQEKADRIKSDLTGFLIRQKTAGKRIVGYGAAAKGNTLLNYCGIKKDLVGFVVDASPFKQGKFLPGSHIPVVNESELRKTKPEYVLILPWNIREEITAQLGYIREWGGKFIVPIPGLQIM